MTRRQSKLQDGASKFAGVQALSSLQSMTLGYTDPGFNLFISPLLSFPFSESKLLTSLLSNQIDLCPPSSPQRREDEGEDREHDQADRRLGRQD